MTRRPNIIWEGPDNILCLDSGGVSSVPHAHEPLLERLSDAVLVSDDDDTAPLLRCRFADLDAAITACAQLNSAVAEARAVSAHRFIGDVYAGALLTEQAAWEPDTRKSDRKARVALLCAPRYLADQGPVPGIDAVGDETIERCAELVGGALVMDC